MSFTTNKKTWLKLATGLVGVLIILRLSAPYVIQNYVNETIQDTQGISGYIGDVDLAIYRGGYSIEHIKIYEIEEFSERKPLLAIERLEFSISWSALINGNLVTKMYFEQPQVVIYDKDPAKDEQNKQVKDETTWIGLANNLVPFSIDSLAIFDGKITLINEGEQGEEPTYLSKINGHISNITNAQNLDKSLVTGFDVKAALMGQATMSLNGKLDPFSEKANFDINLELQRFSVNHIESVFKFYTPFDIEAGSVDGAMELAARDNQLTGYVKAGVYDLSIFSWREDIEKDDDGLFTLIFEGGSELLSEFLENDESELVAARVPIEGELNNTDISTFEALISVLENAFFDAFKMEVDNVISFESIEDKNSDN